MKTGVIYRGDNVLVMKNEIPDESIDAVCMDPDFNSGKVYGLPWGESGKQEIDAFDDRHAGGINHYISKMEPILIECHRVLKDTGSMFLHCDWHASDHLKVKMDEIFGENNLRNKIIWYYPNKIGKSTKQLMRDFDTILFYSKNKKYNKFNVELEEITNQLTLKRYDQVDEMGRYKIYKGKDGKTRKTYLKGKFRGCVWSINWLAANDRERTNFKTQKPEELLERIIRLCSDEGDIILDPTGGSGTTLAVAQRMRRRWIAIDMSRVSIRCMLERLGNVEVIDTAPDIDYLKSLTPKEFQDWVCRWLNGHPSRNMSGDGGVDGRNKDSAIQAKQEENAGPRYVRDFKTGAELKGKKSGIFVAFSFSKHARETAAEINSKFDFEMILKTVEELLDDGKNLNPEKELEYLDWCERRTVYSKRFGPVESKVNYEDLP